MGQAKRAKRTRADELRDEYQALQLTPEQRAAARRKMEQRMEAARRDGVYERAIEIAGTVKWSLSWQELREDE